MTSQPSMFCLPWELFFIFQQRPPSSIYLKRKKKRNDRASWHQPIEKLQRSAYGCFSTVWISTPEFLSLFIKWDVLPNRAAGWQSLSRFTCQQRSCEKTEMWIKAETCPECKIRASLCFYLLCVSVGASRLIGGNSSPARRAIFRLTLTWPPRQYAASNFKPAVHLQTLTSHTYPQDARALTCRTLAPLVFTPLMKCTSLLDLLFQAYRQAGSGGMCRCVCFKNWFISMEAADGEVFTLIYSLYSAGLTLSLWVSYPDGQDPSMTEGSSVRSHSQPAALSAPSSGKNRASFSSHCAITGFPHISHRHIFRRSSKFVIVTSYFGPRCFIMTTLHDFLFKK